MEHRQSLVFLMRSSVNHAKSGPKNQYGYYVENDPNGFVAKVNWNNWVIQDSYCTKEPEEHFMEVIKGKVDHSDSGTAKTKTKKHVVAVWKFENANSNENCANH